MITPSSTNVLVTEIGDMIDAVQSSAQAAVGTMQQAVARVEGGVEMANRAGASMSGISSAEHVAKLHAWGVQSMLVGEALMRADDPTPLLSSLVAAARRFGTPTHVTDLATLQRDAESFAARFEGLLRMMWRDWCGR